MMESTNRPSTPTEFLSRGASMPAQRARGAEAFAPCSIAPYALPGDEVQALNKARWRLLARDAVLLIHDVQNHWVRMFADPAPWLDRLASLRRACDDADVPSIYTCARRTRNVAERGLGLSLWGLGVGSGAGDASAAQVIQPLAPRETDYIIDKPKYSAFFDTELESLMRRLGRRQIILTGVFGHHGIQVTAVDAYMRNLQVFLVADAMADYSADEHASTLRYVAEVCGCVVTAGSAAHALKEPS